MLYKAEVFGDHDPKKAVVTYYIREVNIVEAAIAAKVQLNKDLVFKLKDLVSKHKDKKLRVAKIEEVIGDMI